MAKVLLVDTNFSAAPLRRALLEQGHEVHLCGANPNDALARHAKNYHVTDYADVEALVELAEALCVDHVIPGCNDRAYLSCATAKALTGHCRFNGVDLLEQASVLLDKQLFRDCARALNLTTPQTYSPGACVPSGPVIVKPVDAFSGLGVEVIAQPNQDKLDCAVQKAKSSSASGGALVEDWIGGQLYSHSAFVKDQKILQAHVVVEHCVANPYAVDTSHLAQGALPVDALQALEGELEILARHLQLCDGLLHTQFIWDGQRCWLIELTRRCPGDLYSQLVELTVGPGYVMQYLLPFFGLPLEVVAGQVESNPILRHTLTLPEACTLESLRFNVPLLIERWVPVATVGDSIGVAPKGRIAILFARVGSGDELLSLSQRAKSRTLFSVNAL